MANYGVDIEVALKGVEKLRQFDKLLSHSVDELNKLEKALKNVNKQNPYDVAGARRVTELDKKRTEYIRQQNRLLSQQERHRRTIASEAARASLIDQAAARRAAGTGVQRRTIAGVAYPQGAAPGGAREMAPGGRTLISPQARANQEAAASELVARLQRKENEIKQATRFREIDLINKQISLELDGQERIGKKIAEKNKEWMRDWDVRFNARQEEKREALAIAKVEADAATKRRKDEQQLIAARSKRRKEALGSALIGGAFPLLFGQGVGAAAGGAAGGGLGGLAGGQLGFGLSLVGTALGSVFDQLANSAKETAVALRDPINNFSELKNRSIIASAAQERYIETLISSGQIVKANTEIQREVITKIGAGGVRDFQNLSAAQSKLSRATGEFVLQLQAALAGPLAGLTAWLADFLAVANTARRSRMVTEGGIPTDPAERAKFEQEVLKSYNKVFGTSFTDIKQGRGQLEGQSGFLGYLASSPEGRKELSRIQGMFPGKQDAALTAEVQKRAQLEDGLTKSLEMQAQAERLRLDIAKQTNLTSAKDRELAAKALNDLDYEIAKESIRLQMLREGYNEARNHALHTSAALQHQAREAAAAEQRRQQEIADLQQRISLRSQEYQLSAEAHNLDEQIKSLGVTQEKALENRLLSLREQHGFQTLALQMEHEAVRASDDYSKNQAQINENQKLQTQNLARQQKFEVDSVNRQREALALARLRADQERQLQFAQTEAGFQSQLAGAGINPFVGPFGESARAEQQMALDFALDIKNKQFEIQQIRDQIAATTDQEEIQNLTKRREGLEKLLALHQQYVPQINAAALEQQRFNEALQFTQPVVDGVFQSLTAVADGTKTAQQAFADFLRTIANMLVDVAAQMIATYVAIGIARSFAGVPAGSSSNGMFGAGAPTETSAGGGIFRGAGPFQFRANGGSVSSGQPYIVGERGPELFMPGSGGRIISNEALRRGGFTSSGFLGFHPLALAAMSGVGNFGGNRLNFLEMMGFAPRANGGPVNAGGNYLVGERGPEVFVPQGGGGGGGVQVGAINISVQNTGEQLSPAAQKQIANQVQGIVMSTLVNERRSGGVLR